MDLDVVRFVIKQIIIEGVALFCFVMVLGVMCACFLIFTSLVSEEIVRHIRCIACVLSPWAIVITENALEWQAPLLLFCVVFCVGGHMVSVLWRKKTC